MNTYRKTAISVGVLFIIATVLGMLGNIPLKPILDAPDYLISISANENQVNEASPQQAAGYLTASSD